MEINLYSGIHFKISKIFLILMELIMQLFAHTGIIITFSFYYFLIRIYIISITNYSHTHTHSDTIYFKLH